MSVASPVFIVGTARSGTSLLYRTLLQHPDFSIPEMCLEESKIFHLAISVSRLQRHQGSPYKYMLRDDEQYALFIESINTLAIRQKALSQIPRYQKLCQRLPILWNMSGGAKVVRQFFLYAQRARGGSRIVEKTPSHVQYVDQIIRTYPDARILFITRHPVDVFTSHRRRYQVERELGKKAKWLKVAVDDFISTYRLDVEAGLLHADHYPDNVGVISYESFTAFPKREFKRICGFIGAPFVEGPVRERCDSLSSWKPDPHLAKPISPSTKEWSDYATKKEAAVIEEALSELLNQLGYDRYSKL
jgi:hypothetical protein